MKRKRKRPIPILLLWSKGEQLRFCNAVEQLVSAARDLAGQVTELRAERQAAQRKYERRRAARAEAEQLTPAAGAGRGEGGDNYNSSSTDPKATCGKAVLP